jgi:uncharacterized membrane protein
MRTTVWDFAVIALTAVTSGVAAAVREPSVGAAGGGAFWGLIVGALFCTFVRLVTLPLERAVEALRARVAELERRGGGPGPTAT